jgi:uncharacterized protein (TIGR02147 family)
MNTFLEYQNYKLLLSDYLADSPRGESSRLAQYLNVQPSFLSQVLRGNPNLSLEQGLRATEYLKYGEVEKEYFLLLLEHAKAGSEDLRKYFFEKLERIRTTQREVESQLKGRKNLKENDRRLYDSDWLYSALHIALSIPRFQNPPDLAKALYLNPKIVEERLDDLVAMGLVNRSKGVYSIREFLLHSGRKNSTLRNFHATWRSKAISKLMHEFDDERNLHFSAALSFSKDDFSKIKDIIVRSIKKVDEQIIHSKEECLSALCIDFFELAKS